MTDTIVISQPLSATILYSTEQGPPGFTDVSPVIKLGGDVLAVGTTGSVTVPVTLANTSVVAGTYGSSSQIAAFVVDSKGRIQQASSVSIQLPATAITSGSLAKERLPAFEGDVTSTVGTNTLTLNNSGVLAGTYSKVTVNSKGLVTVGTAITNIADLGITNVYTKLEVDAVAYNSTPSFLTLRNKPVTLGGYGIGDAYTKAEVDLLVGNTAVSWSTLTGKPNTIAGYNITDALSNSSVGTVVASLVLGKIPASQLPSYVDDVLEFASLAGFPALGEEGKIYVSVDTNLTYRWSGSTYISMGGTTTDAASLVSGTLGAARLPALTGSDVSSAAGTGALVLSTTGVTAGTYKNVTVDIKGRVTAGSNPTTLAGFGITDAQVALVSGTTIKTINGASILGSGDIVVASSYTLPPATPTTLGGVKVDGTTITVDGAGKISAVGGGSGGTGAFASFSIVDGELVVEHSSSFTLSIVDGEFISEYN
jgi:phage-related tail fiber protein